MQSLNQSLCPHGNGDQAVIKVSAVGIAVDRKSEWLCYDPLNGCWIYRLKTSDLIDET